MLRTKRMVSVLLVLMMMFGALMMPAAAEEKFDPSKLVYTNDYIFQSAYQTGLPFKYIGFHTWYDACYGPYVVASPENYSTFGVYNLDTREWVIEPKCLLHQVFDSTSHTAPRDTVFLQPPGCEGYVAFHIETGKPLVDDTPAYQWQEAHYVGLNTYLVRNAQDKSFYLFNSTGRVFVSVGEVKWVRRGHDITTILGFGACHVAINGEQRLIQIVVDTDIAFDGSDLKGKYDITKTFHIDEKGNITPYSGEFTGEDWYVYLGKNYTAAKSGRYFGADSLSTKCYPYVQEAGSSTKKYIKYYGQFVDVTENGICFNGDSLNFIGRIVRITPEPTPGTPMGDVLYTDIVAYIDDKPIRSYNIAGNTYIVVEDLAAYGFDVQWHAEGAGMLVVGTTRTAKPDDYTTTYVPETNTQPVGSVAMQYLYTNINTWLGNKHVTGYNIGGFTCIGMDDLANTFATNYVWDGVEGALRLYTQP